MMTSQPSAPNRRPAFLRRWRPSPHGRPSAISVLVSINTSNRTSPRGRAKWQTSPRPGCILDLQQLVPRSTEHECRILGRLVSHVAHHCIVQILHGVWWQATAELPTDQKRIGSWPTHEGKTMSLGDVRMPRMKYMSPTSSSSTFASKPITFSWTAARGRA